MTKRLAALMFFVCILLTVSLGQPKERSLAEKIKRFAPTEITADVSVLSDGDRDALEKLIEAAKYMDEIYLRQVWSGNVSLKKKLKQDTSPAGREKLHYFSINLTPWPKIDEEQTYLPGVPDRKFPGANYYPEDMPKEEFGQWLDELLPEDRKKATGFFHVIRRDNNGNLMLTPYSQEYKEFLVPAAKLLKEAASLTSNASLRAFLEKRADAFLSDNYYESDVAWMDLDSPIDVTIGPYEVYLDELFNYKAAFEAFITLRDEKETAKLEKFSSYLQEIENNLPIDPQYRNPNLGSMSPIRVVDEVYVGGEARAGVQTAAFNLPNDENVTKEKGSKRVMLKNVQEAKFNKVLKPITAKVISASQQGMVEFEPFFTHILAHELLHGLGPNIITKEGKQTTVREQMQALSSAMEEAKADIAGLFALQYLIDKGVVAKSMEQPMYVTFLAGIFRSVRFGITESHGRGMALQFNYLWDNKAIIYDAQSGTFTADIDRMKEAAKTLTGELLTIQATGDFTKAKELFERLAVIRPEMQKVLDGLSDIPVDIDPQFPLAGD